MGGGCAAGVRHINIYRARDLGVVVQPLAGGAARRADARAVPQAPQPCSDARAVEQHLEVVRTVRSPRVGAHSVAVAAVALAARAELAAEAAVEERELVPLGARLRLGEWVVIRLARTQAWIALSRLLHLVRDGRAIDDPDVVLKDVIPRRDAGGRGARPACGTRDRRAEAVEVALDLADRWRGWHDAPHGAEHAQRCEQLVDVCNHERCSWTETTKAPRVLRTPVTT